ncbi:uncharacterized protein LOC120466920 [Pimephales promelas]|uniref:uncharacterized protein LOC120466920 n=1 Tax=Pimephales promelas TaxID=90988 RepID=UPI001955AD1B|nr:uncharacterized protein LOC120466920 [Pimephales promelas]KAG1960135.1 si:rp71-1d10.8 [Pimephales promelas]
MNGECWFLQGSRGRCERMTRRNIESSRLQRSAVAAGLGSHDDSEDQLKTDGHREAHTHKDAIMVRTYKRKTTRASTAPETMLKAVRQVLVFKKTIRGAAEEFGINYRTLARYCTKIPREEVEGAAEHPSCSVGFIAARQVFSAALEAELVSYVLMATDVYHTLPPKAIRKLSYQLAEGQQLHMPPSWRENKQASVDWFAAFIKRHPLLSASLASVFNKEMFYVKLKALMERHSFKPEDIWVMEETGITTAQRPDRVVSRRQPGSSVTAPDRGPLVSVAATVSASGAVIPPYFVFPRVQFREHFLTGAPAGSSGGAHISGWMREEQFLHFLQHLVRQTRCSPEKPCLLLLDVHLSHLSIDGLNFAKANGVVALSFPPHLERSVCGPFQKCINAAIDCWTLGSPGRSVTIHHIPGIVATALPQAATADNITAGFEACGVFPLNSSASGQQGSVTDCAVAPASTGSCPSDKPTLETEVLLRASRVGSRPSQT